MGCSTRSQHAGACYVAGFFIESTAPTHQDSLTSALKAAGAQADTSFESLGKMILRWAIAALQTGPVSADQVTS